VSGENPNGTDAGDVQSYTVTVDHALTSGLTGKFEYRYNDSSVNVSENVIAAQLLYQF